MSDALPVMTFHSVEGSITSKDGQSIFLRAGDHDGNDLMLGFPHGEILSMVECLAMQAENGIDKSGRKITTALNAMSFEVGHGPQGEPVLALAMGQTGKISYLLPAQMVSQLMDSLARFSLKH